MHVELKLTRCCKNACDRNCMRNVMHGYHLSQGPALAAADGLDKLSEPFLQVG
jgi:hypothetical protein